MTVSSKIRIYDLAKELKLDTKRLIEEVRREGVDVRVVPDLGRVLPYPPHTSSVLRVRSAPVAPP